MESDDVNAKNEYSELSCSDFFFNFTDAMIKLKLVNRGVSRFAKSQMNSQQKRDKVYYTWLCLREMDVDKSKLKRNLEEYRVPLEVYLGKEDKIITENQFGSFTNLPQIDCKVILLPTEHSDLIAKTAEYLSHPGD